MERWPGLSDHFEPLRDGPEELVRRVAQIRRDSPSFRSAAHRLPVPSRESHVAAWNLHFLQRKVARRLDGMRDCSEV